MIRNWNKLRVTGDKSPLTSNPLRSRPLHALTRQRLASPSSQMKIAPRVVHVVRDLFLQGVSVIGCRCSVLMLGPFVRGHGKTLGIGELVVGYT